MGVPTNVTSIVDQVQPLEYETGHVRGDENAHVTQF